MHTSKCSLLRLSAAHTINQYIASLLHSPSCKFGYYFKVKLSGLIKYKYLSIISFKLLCLFAFRIFVLALLCTFVHADTYRNYISQPKLSKPIALVTVADTGRLQWLAPLKDPSSPISDDQWREGLLLELYILGVLLLTKHVSVLEKRVKESWWWLFSLSSIQAGLAFFVKLKPPLKISRSATM